MNKYIVPICDIQTGDLWTKVIVSRDQNDCQEKVMQYLINEYEELDYSTSYREFCNEALNNHDIVIGDILDIELI